MGTNCPFAELSVKQLSQEISDSLPPLISSLFSKVQRVKEEPQIALKCMPTNLQQ